MTVIDPHPLVVESIEGMEYSKLTVLLEQLKRGAAADENKFFDTLTILNRLLDFRYPTGSKKRSSVVHLVQETIVAVLSSLPKLAQGKVQPGGTGGGSRAGHHALLLNHDSRFGLSRPSAGCSRLAIDATGFPIEGDLSLARTVVDACALGWKHLLLFRLKGHRFVGCGLASLHPDCRIDVYGSSGDYVASGLDGGEIVVHGSAQDQAGNILKSGKVVVAGDVGQAFMYAAKGGEVFVQGSAAGRPLINAVGCPRVVINGTALDYLAESFMAGDPAQGGGFVVLNGVEYDLEGRLREKASPYPGGNLFSLASGGAIYIRDPRRKVQANQLNGGRFSELSDRDWAVIRPMLEENERLFGIKISDLLVVDGRPADPFDVYRKVEPVSLKALKG